MTNYRFDSLILDISRSIDFDKENFLIDMQEALGVSPEIFAYFFVLEEYPITISRQESFADHNNDSVIFRVSQEFRIRRRTAEELLMLEEHIQETKNKELNLR